MVLSKGFLGPETNADRNCALHHEPWCAQVIAENAELFWRVRCDCKPPKPKKPKKARPLPLFDLTRNIGRSE